MDDDADMAELLGNLERVMAENVVLTRLLSTDAGQAGLVAEVKRLTAENDALRERNAGLQEEKNLAIRAAKTAVKSATKAVRKLIPGGAA